MRKEVKVIDSSFDSAKLEGNNKIIVIKDNGSIIDATNINLINNNYFDDKNVLYVSSNSVSIKQD